MNKAENNITGKKSSFWELTSECAVVIPIIQRDYAQGRQSDDVRQIRKKFVSQIYFLLKEDKEMDLDFIYGTLETPNTIINSNADFLNFVPLDGQQRLTTLFLLHWFMSLFNSTPEGIDDYDDFKKHMIIPGTGITRFTYHTRTSSSDFCRLLVTKANREKIVNSITDKAGSSTIRDIIIDEGWFHDSWKFDPSIQGMLVMLNTLSDAIPKNDIKETAHDFYIKLTKKQLISFNLLYLNKVETTDEKGDKIFKNADDHFSDELYIKMNSRGKPLSDFETFKSRFEAFLRNYTDINEKTFASNIDHNWADAFWKIRNNVTPKNKDKVIRDNTDRMMMNLINVVLANAYALSENAQADVMNVLFQTEAARKRNLDLRLTFYRYTELGVLKETYDEIGNHLKHNTNYGREIIDAFDFITNYINNRQNYDVPSTYLDTKECINKVIFDSIDDKPRDKQSRYGAIRYADRLYFYAWSRFCILCSDKLMDPEDKDIHRNLVHWMHFVRNIVESTEINEVSDMQKSLKVICDFLNILKEKYNFDIKSYLNSLNQYPDWSPIPYTQVREEILKVRLISHCSEWEKPIEDADNIPSWPGRSGYLLYFAGLADKSTEQLDNMTEADHRGKIKVYNSYLHKVKVLMNVITYRYSSGNGNDKEHILERFLLTEGNYMRSLGYYKEYKITIFSMMNSSIDGRSYSWRQLVQYNGIPDANGQDVIDKLNAKTGVDVLKLALDDITDEQAKDEDTMEKTIKQVISSPSPDIDSWRKDMIEEPRLWNEALSHFFWLKDDGEAWVPRKTHFNSNQYELKSYRLKLKLSDSYNDAMHWKYMPHENGYLYLDFKDSISDKHYRLKLWWSQPSKDWIMDIRTWNEDHELRLIDEDEESELSAVLDINLIRELKDKKNITDPINMQSIVGLQNKISTKYEIV